MTIRIYPSRLPGEPLETHEHGVMTICDWFRWHVKGWQFETTHPVAVEVDGVPVPPIEWGECTISPESDVRMYPVPYGTGFEIAAWIAVAVSVASLAYALIMSNVDTSGYSQKVALVINLN